MPDPFKQKIVKAGRVHTVTEAPVRQGPVVYWMSRDQRAEDNWALLCAQEAALGRREALAVVFCLAPAFLGATLRQYRFMLDGLRETAARLAARRIPFFLLAGDPARAVPRFLREQAAGLLVTDFDPLRIKRDWQAAVARAAAIPFIEVDAHNIVPCRVASPKQEYGAYTIRPKIAAALVEYLGPFPALKRHSRAWQGRVPAPQWDRALASLGCDRSVGPVSWIRPGPAAADLTLKAFLQKKLAGYDEARNDPVRDGQSGLSPYLHFGQLSAQRVALEVRKAPAGRAARDAFLEELVVRRELADNFCFYNPYYDTAAGFPSWARKTLAAHRGDARAYRYPLRAFEEGRTHDPLWNAAQREMVLTGKMHGYMRMYWAKKILEWSVSPEAAMKTAVYLNDRYELDGRDPNGYAGIAWSIGGVHDRAWFPRPVYGSVRYMSASGCRSKFDVEAYIAAQAGRT